MTSVEEWLGKDNTLGIDIWNKKYRQNDETFDQWLERVSGGDKEVQRLILERKFLFGGRILSNRGTGMGTTSNCFVIETNDSIRDIYKTASDMATVFKSGGGVGVDISPLAPSGAKVNNPAKSSSGAVSFVDLFTATSGLIGQNGRRAALMISMSCTHPDIADFIKLKTDVNKATTANLSIRVTDDFMKAVKEDKNWNLIFHRKETNEDIVKTVKARDLFKQFCDANYDYGEPGLLFWDTMETNNMLNTYPNFKLNGVNPCFSGDTKILTDNGYIPIVDRVGKLTTIWNGYEWSEVIPQITGYDQPMFLVKFDNGSEIKCTDYHKFILSDGSRVMCKDLRIGDFIKKYNMPVMEGIFEVSFEKAYTNGFYSGDGFFPKDKSAPRITLYGEKTKLVKYIQCKHFNKNAKDNITTYLEKDGYLGSAWDKLFVPNHLFSIKTRLDWLAGLIDSDGTKNDEGGSITISSVNLEFLKDVSLMLNTLGVSPRINVMKESGYRELPLNDGSDEKGLYYCQKSYRLILSANIVKSLMVLGLKTYRVPLVANPNRCCARGFKVTSIERIENEDVVYCLTEPKNHSVVVNGIMTAQCGELPLPNGGACLLGSINLAEYVDELTRFKFDEFGKDVRTAIRALDTVQEEGIQYLPLEIQREIASDWKQLGLGIMGLGDMLIKMNVRYGSEFAKAICDEIGDTLAKNAIEESIILGKERGNFPMFISENTINSSFYKKHQLTDRKIEYMRNSQLLAIAPTGCQKGDTYVATSDGLLKLKEIVDVRGDTWQEINDLVATQDYQKNPISKGFINGYKPTKIITLENGLELECTHNHQYRVWRDGEYIWSRADELQTGDAIVSKIGYYDKTSPFVFKDIKLENYNNLSNVIKMPSMMNENLAFLIGAYYANGSNHYKGKDKKFHQIRFAMNANKFEDIAKIANIIYEQFGIEPGFSKGNSSGSATSIDVTSVNLANWLVANGIKKKYAIDNEIPFCIRTSRKEDILAFIQGYAFCDGSHSKNNVYIDTASKTMAQDLCIIMRAVGIDAKIYTNTKRTGAKSKNPMYRVYYNLSRSVGLEDKLVHVRKDIRLAHLDVKKSLGDGFVVDKIKSIQDSVCMTYDIEVENEHHYLANGVVSHNTISTMLGISGGIEPLYALEYERTTKSLHGADKSYKVVPKVVAEAFDRGRTDGLVCSADIDYKDRIAMQSVWQKHIDGSISSTINLPNDFPREKIYDIYMTAWEKGLKGVTVFRDGCKRAGILNTKPKSDEDTDEELIGYRKKIITGCGPLWLNIFCDKDGNVKNTFSIKGSGGGCEKNLIGLSRMVSLALRNGIPIEKVLDQLDSCGVCPSYATQRAKGVCVSPGSSCPSAMANAIREIVAKTKGNKPEPSKDTTPRCPECNAKLKAEGGCFICDQCGFSKCN